MRSFELQDRRAAEVRISGVVQGVGFRPAVCRMARARGLGGWVRNDGIGVHLEIEGPPDALDDFLAVLPVEAPVAARIEALEVRPVPPRGRTRFDVVASAPGPGRAAVPADRGPCSR